MNLFPVEISKQQNNEDSILLKDSEKLDLEQLKLYFYDAPNWYKIEINTKYKITNLKKKIICLGVYQTFMQLNQKHNPRNVV